MTNLKLYFDKFEDELPGKDLEEPTTPEYEQEKDKQQGELGADDAGGLGGEQGELEL